MHQLGKLPIVLKNQKSISFTPLILQTTQNSSILFIYFAKVSAMSKSRFMKVSHSKSRLKTSSEATRKKNLSPLRIKNIKHLTIVGSSPLRD